MNTRRSVFAFTAATGATLAALALSTATAGADNGVWTIGPATGFGYDPPEVLSESGIPPFDQTVVTQGEFDIHQSFSSGVDQEYVANGVLTSTQGFGYGNTEFISNQVAGDLPNHTVVDILTIGNFENIYTDLPGIGGPNGPDFITDTVVTPFGNFDIPTTFDASAFDIAPATAADASTSGFAAALEADWATLVTDFSALF